MRCDEINALLDRLLDGELSEEQLQALRAHGQECPQCAGQIEAAMQMKALFGEMTPEADVPLAAQAAWRSAVKAEARRKRSRRFTAWAGMAAAAVVLVLGVGLALNTPNAPKLHTDAASAPIAESAETAGEAEMSEANQSVDESEPVNLMKSAAVESAPRSASEEAPAAAAESGEDSDIITAGGAMESFDAAEPEQLEEADYEMADMAYLEADGAGEAERDVPMNDAAAMPALSVESEDAEEAGEEAIGFAAEAAAPEAAAPVHELSLKVESIDAACGAIVDLVSEYEGTADVQRLDSGANIYVDMPAGNVAEFISAVAHLDVSGSELKAPETDGEAVSALLLTLSE